MRYNRRMRFFRIDLLKGNLWVQTLLFFIPILIGAFFQQLYNTVDAIVVGQYLGPNALGAVGGSTGTLVNLFVGLFMGISSGAAVVLSHAVGAFDKHRIKHNSYLYGHCVILFSHCNRYWISFCTEHVKNGQCSSWDV